MKVSRDGGKSWEETGSLDATPNELAVAPDGTLYASVPGGEVRFSRDDGATWRSYVVLA